MRFIASESQLEGAPLDNRERKAMADDGGNTVRRSRSLAWLFLGVSAAVIILGTLAWGWVGTGASHRVVACEVLDARSVEAVLGRPVEPRAFEPDGARELETTACSYGDGEPGSYLTVFASWDGEDLFTRGASSPANVGTDANGVPYQTRRGVGPRDGSETFFLLHEGRYVNVITYNAAPGSADLLLQAAVVAFEGKSS